MFHFCRSLNRCEFSRWTARLFSIFFWASCSEGFALFLVVGAADVAVTWGAFIDGGVVVGINDEVSSEFEEWSSDAPTVIVARAF